MFLSSVTRIEMHHWTHLFIMNPVSTYAQWKDRKALFARIAFVSYAILLTLNQGLSKSMDALKTKFQGKVFSVAVRKGMARL
jgi:tryptophan-rich sensory protein